MTLPKGWRDKRYGVYLVRQTRAYAMRDLFQYRYWQKLPSGPIYNSIRVIKDGQALAYFSTWAAACRYAAKRSKDNEQ